MIRWPSSGDLRAAHSQLVGDLGLVQRVQGRQLLVGMALLDARIRADPTDEGSGLIQIETKIETKIETNGTARDSERARDMLKRWMEPDDSRDLTSRETQGSTVKNRHALDLDGTNSTG